MDIFVCNTYIAVKCELHAAVSCALAHIHQCLTCMSTQNESSVTHISNMAAIFVHLCMPLADNLVKYL